MLVENQSNNHSEPDETDEIISLGQTGRDTGSSSFDTVESLTVLPYIKLPIRVQIVDKSEIDQ